MLRPVIIIKTIARVHPCSTCQLLSFLESFPELTFGKTFLHKISAFEIAILAGYSQAQPILFVPFL